MGDLTYKDVLPCPVCGFRPKPQSARYSGGICDCDLFSVRHLSNVWNGYVSESEAIEGWNDIVTNDPGRFYALHDEEGGE